MEIEKMNDIIKLALQYEFKPECQILKDLQNEIYFFIFD
jgi:hypothetical protein